MDLLAALSRERRPLQLYHLRFTTPGFESQFREWQRRRYGVTRMLLFAVFAIAVFVTPFFGSLFSISAGAEPLLRTIHWQLMLPLALCGAVAGYIPMPEGQRALQTAAALSLWGGMLLLRWLSLQGAWHYPSQLVGLSVIAVALFGGYSWQRVVSGTVLFAILSIWVELHGATADSHAGLQVYTLIITFLMALAGAFTHELMSRLMWLNRRHSEVMAATDGLTGLANHYEFHRSLERVLAQAARDQRTVGVALLDLDHFKSINDRYGHLFGDRVLREVGALLRMQVARRPLDLRARYGGEEMAIVWYDAKPDALAGLVEEVLDQIRNLPFADPAGGLRIRITASVGLCWLVPTEQTRAEDVLHSADLLLYCAKSEGRDRGCLAPFENGLQSISETHAAANGAGPRTQHGLFGE